MISMFWLLQALLADPCALSVGSPEILVDQHPAGWKPGRNVRISISRSYGVPWAICAEEKGGTPPRLRVTARDDLASYVVLEKSIELPKSVRNETTALLGQLSGCEDRAPNRRDPTAVLRGPVGRRHWYNRRTFDIELLAEGPFAPLAFKAQTEVYCPACDDDDDGRGAVTFSYVINDLRKQTVETIVSVDKARFECAKGGGRMTLRRFWADDLWAPLRPYAVIDNLQERLKPDDDRMTYRSVESAASFCKAGRLNLLELVGIDEYSSIFSESHASSRAVRRIALELFGCK